MPHTVVSAREPCAAPAPPRSQLDAVNAAVVSARERKSVDRPRVGDSAPGVIV
jgi:hypothetical protein